MSALPKTEESSADLAAADLRIAAKEVLQGSTHVGWEQINRFMDRMIERPELASAFIQESYMSDALRQAAGAYLRAALADMNAGVVHTPADSAVQTRRDSQMTGGRTVSPRPTLDVVKRVSKSLFVEQFRMDGVRLIDMSFAFMRGAAKRGGLVHRISNIEFNHAPAEMSMRDVLAQGWCTDDDVRKWFEESNY
jgi:hypothetical protein